MTNSAHPQKTFARSHSNYYPILDALRFILAFWVVVGHIGVVPLFGQATTRAGLLSLIQRGWSSVIFGTPAVIVFFVISGFCIHLPFRDDLKIDVARYYMRRYTRILIPVAAALVLFRVAGYHLILVGEHSILWASPLWSLACEEIYYAMYPALRWVRQKAGWRVLLATAFAISVPIAATHVTARDWHVFGPLGTAMILLPVWLLGCLLAEQAQQLSIANRKSSIWLWRFIVWFASWLGEMMHFKLHISFTQTMLWFGVLAFFWIRQEIIHGNLRAPSRFLVAAGAWSYSLYLVHILGADVRIWLRLPSLGAFIDWFIVMGFALLFSYVFYLLVERPSHSLARKFKIISDRKTRTPIGSVEPAVEAPLSFEP
jgi:peptidoglycan/LPS O-acetylase OafA/YrhL